MIQLGLFDEVDSKVCTGCKINKPVEEYHKKKRGKFGLRSKCKSCKKQQDKEWNKNNKEHKKEKSKEYYEANSDKLKLYKKQYREKNQKRKRPFV